MQGHLPSNVVRTFRAFLEFCYIARRDVITEDDLDGLQGALLRFHSFREVFGPIRGINGFSLPRQHAMVHYPALIRLFGAPNGLCTSITESKHIRAVKEPWRRSNRNAALFQMLTTNQRLDQLGAVRDDFTKRGMLNGTILENLLSNGTYNNIQLVQLTLTHLLGLHQDQTKAESFSTELPGNDIQQAGTPIADEDIQGAITDDDHAEVKFPQRSRTST